MDIITGWVIQNEAGEYLMVDATGAFTWTPGAEWALHFVREDDAKMLCRADKQIGQIGLWRNVALKNTEVA